MTQNLDNEIIQHSADLSAIVDGSFAVQQDKPKTRTVFGHEVEVKDSEHKSLTEIPDSQIRTAIFQSFGNRAALARLLNVNYTTLRGFLKENKKYGELFQEAKSRLVDDAEDYIRKALNDQNLDSRTRIDLAKFILKTQGRDQGWSESPTVAQQINVSGEKVDLKTIFGISSDA